MKRYIKFNESKDIYSYLNSDITEKNVGILKDWLDSLNFKSGKSPKGMKKERDDLLFLQRQLDVAEQFNYNPGSFHNVKAVFSRWDKKKIDLITSKFSIKGEESNTLKLKNALYINESNMNYKKFVEASTQLDKHLSTLKGFHKKALTIKELKVVFVKKSFMKVGGKYNNEKDILYIRPERVIPGNNYGSFNYVVTHELGHRYEKYFNIPVDFDSSQWWTTKYSQSTNSWTGEQFAELFALSHYRKMYPEYEDKINKFIDIIR